MRSIPPHACLILPGFPQRVLIATILSLWSLCSTASAWSAEPDVNQKAFDTRVAPILANRCLSCHNGAEKKGGLNLASSSTAFAGGDSGKAIQPGKPDESLIWEKVSQDEMPPKKPLSSEEKAILKQWIADGAKWGGDPIDPFRYASGNRAGYDWWSLKPITKPVPPEVKQTNWPRNEIDRFVLAKLEANGLEPSPEADRRTYLRRLSFDLLGLPPCPEEVAAFITDKSPDAYEKLVNRLLDSSAYGERWARHWLDVVRFGESQGFERDRLRPNSWRYRDWVVQSLNQDLPYNEFVRQQLAGDVLAPDNPFSVIATGYLVAAPWDEVGQSQQSAAMRAVVRQDELEDIVGTTMQTFMGLTANCARCHDHKFDPIRQKEYFQLVAALGGVRHGERESLTVAARSKVQPRLDELERLRKPLADALTALEAPLRDKLKTRNTATTAPTVAPPTPIARWDFNGDLRDSLGSLHGNLHGNARIENGRLILDGQNSYAATAPLSKQLTEKTLEVWVKLPNLKQQGGGVMSVQKLDGGSFDAIVFGEREAGKWFPGSDGFSRSQDLVEAEVERVAEKEFVHVVLVYRADRFVLAYRNGRPYGQPYQASGLVTFEAGQSQVVFGLRHSPAGGNRMLSGEIERAQLYDRALTPNEIAASAGMPLQPPEITTEQILAEATPTQRQTRADIVRRLSELETEIRLLSGGSTYAVTPRQPEPTHMLTRGNPATPAEEVHPGGIQAVGATAEFVLPKDSPEAVRRIQLANWIVDPQNPLTSRVIVNRLWHYHFGAGIVDTPNDLGYNGARPTHPELLDWLASEFMRQNWSLKSLHRMIVLSATYRQAADIRPKPALKDAENRLYWRKTPMRLEAEALHDAVLVVAGELNPVMGGPGFQDFKTFTANSQFYEPIDPIGITFQRRSLYRTWIRSGRNPLLDVLDCPDPSTTAPKRAVTTTPLQALSLLNNSFMLRMADKLAARLQTERPAEIPAQVTLAYELVLQRIPSTDEQQLASQFVSQHGLPAFARVLLNCNEFLYVD